MSTMANLLVALGAVAVPLRIAEESAAPSTVESSLVGNVNCHPVAVRATVRIIGGQ